LTTAGLSGGFGSITDFEYRRGAPPDHLIMDISTQNIHSEMFNREITRKSRRKKD
jgi:hypothetical protein